MIVDLPRGWIARADWRHLGGATRQRSALTGRSRVVLLSPSAHWHCRAEIRPGASAEVAAWHQLAAALRLGVARVRVPVWPGWQYRPGGGAISVVRNSDWSEGWAGWSAGAGFDHRRADQPAPAIWTVLIYGSPPGALISERVAISQWGAAQMYVAISMRPVSIQGPLSIAIQQESPEFYPLQTSVFTFSGADQAWSRGHWSFTPHPNTYYVRAVISSSFGTGYAGIADFRLGYLPERAMVSSVSSPQLIGLTGLAPSRLHLSAGALVTVALPGGDEQLLALARPVWGDAVGNGEARFATPLRASPAIGASVELARPTCLMGLSEFQMGWSVESAEITTPDQIELEEVF